MSSPKVVAHYSEGISNAVQKGCWNFKKCAETQLYSWTLILRANKKGLISARSKPSENSLFFEYFSSNFFLQLTENVQTQVESCFLSIPQSFFS